MNISLKFDDSALLLRLRNGEKRLAYATVNAINDTAKTAQASVREGVSSRFTLRKKAGFILQQSAVIRFASVRRGTLFADLEVAPGKKRLLLPEFESGGVHSPRPGRRNVAIPVLGGARPSKGEDIPEALYIKALHFRRAKARQLLLQGEKRTYLVPGVGIFQRQDSGPSRALYLFKHDVRLRPVLRFVATIREVADRSFAREIDLQIALTLARNAGR